MSVRKNRRANTLYLNRYEVWVLSRGEPHADLDLAVIKADLDAGDKYVGGVRNLGAKPLRTAQAVEYLKMLGCPPHSLGLGAIPLSEEAEDVAVADEFASYLKP
jgi:hypothetical protein